MKKGQSKYVQSKNPKSGHYVKIDREKGNVVGHKNTPGPYKGIPVARHRKKGGQK